MLYSMIIFIIISIIILNLIYFLSKKYNVFNFNPNKKYKQLESMRGVAALGVILSHSILSYGYKNDKTWWWTNSIFEGNQYLVNISNNLGGMSVSMFFILTSYLFFDKFLFTSDFSVREFYKKRIFRLLPMYIFSVFLIFILYIFLGVKDNLSLSEIIKFIISWFSFGYWSGESISNLIPDGFVANAGVLWTLIIEWKFYIIFPLILIIFSNLYVYFFSFLLVFLLCQVQFISERESVILNYFIFGGFLAFILKGNCCDKFIKFFLQTKMFFCFINLFLFYFIIYVNDPYVFKVCVLLCLLFFSIIKGNTIFGILKMNAFSFLGNISYSTYLIHGIVLCFVNSFFELTFIVSSTLCLCTTILFSMFTFKNIEYRFIK